MARVYAPVLGEGNPSIQYGLASRCANVNSQTFVYEPVAQRLRVEAGCLSVGAQSRIRVVGCSDASVGRWSFESVPQYAGKQWGQWRLGGSNKCLQLESIPESIDKTLPRLIADECDSQNGRRFGGRLALNRLVGTVCPPHLLFR